MYGLLSPVRVIHVSSFIAPTFSVLCHKSWISCAHDIVGF